MGLYDRNYQFARSMERAQQNDTALVNFVKTTYKFFAASLLFATIGALFVFFGGYTGFVYENKWLFFIAEIAALFGLMFSRSKPGLNVAMLFIFTTLSGVVITPLVASVGISLGFEVVGYALAMATIVFGAMSIFAIKTRADLGNMGKMLFISLIAVIVCSLANLYFQLPMLQVGIAAVCVVLFSLYTAYDTQNIIRGVYSSPVDAAISLYLDFYNLFVSILQLFGIFGNSRD